MRPYPSSKPEPAEHVSKRLLARILEVTKDAEKSARLTEWETKFIADLGARAEQWRGSMAISPRQLEAFERIEAKLYEVG